MHQIFGTTSVAMVKKTEIDLSTYFVSASELLTKVLTAIAS